MAKDDTAVYLSIRQLAAEFGCSRDLVRQIISESGIAPAKQRRGYGVYRLRDFTGAFLAHRQSVSPYERLATARAVKTEDEIRVRRGQLCDAVDVQRTLGRVIQRLVRWAETAVDVLERDAGLSPAQVTALERTLARLREELHAEMTS